LSSLIVTQPLPSGARTTIRTIIIIVAIVLVAIWGGVASWVVTSRQQAIDGASLEARNLMVAFREEIAFILRGIDGEMNLIVERMRRERDGFDLYAWGQQEVLVVPGIAQATIIGPHGNLRQTTIDPHPGPIDLSGRTHFRIHLDGKFHGLYIGTPAKTQLTGQHFFPISRRVEAEDSSFLGVLVFLISPGELTRLPKSIDLGPHGVMTLSGLDAIVLARFSADSPDGTKEIGSWIGGTPRPEIIEEGGEGEFQRTSLLDGIPRLFAYGRVGAYPLVITVGLELDRVLAPWRSSAAMIVGMTLSATLLLIGLAVYLIRQVFRDARVVRATTLAVTHTAEHDFLTGLPNRMLLDDRIGRAITAAQRHKSKLAVLFMDLDGFKAVNDSLGHQIGDKLLQSVAKRLNACVRGSDTVSRQGGDEFVALLSELRDPEDAAIAAQKMLQAVAEVHSIDRHDLRVTASIGVSIFPEDGPDAETLVKNADAAMYEAKANGRHCYRFFTPAINVRAVQRQSIEADLRLALERHEFALHYQPKINLKTGMITGAEALLRWNHPTGRLIARAEFMPVAEDCGLILPIGAWVLREACGQIRACADAGLPLTTMSVNVSETEFWREDFVKGLFAILDETGLDPRLLELELTERVLMKDAEAAVATLQTLRDRGVQVAVDNLGTGYSRLSYLRKFPVDALKIDQSFVHQISTGGDGAIIVTAVIAMARNLNLRVVAEGVETLQQLEFLQTHECDEAQGYYFSRPLPAGAFTNLLRSGIPRPAILGHRSLVMT
jgi:diguanylate cyclase (GGDEF)-like protein